MPQTPPSPPRQGEQAPALQLPSADHVCDIPDPAGRTIVLMFFHEASTPACAVQLTTLYGEMALLSELNAVPMFISVDPPERQARFAGALGLPSRLMVSDLTGEAARAYGVYDESSGRAYRAAFVIGGNGEIALALPRYNPSNSDQLLAIFDALGLGVLKNDEEGNG